MNVTSIGLFVVESPNETLGTKAAQDLSETKVRVQPRKRWGKSENVRNYKTTTCSQSWEDDFPLTCHGMKNWKRHKKKTRMCQSTFFIGPTLLGQSSHFELWAFDLHLKNNACAWYVSLIAMLPRTCRRTSGQAQEPPHIRSTSGEFLFHKRRTGYMSKPNKNPNSSAQFS